MRTVCGGGVVVRRGGLGWCGGERVSEARGCFSLVRSTPLTATRMIDVFLRECECMCGCVFASLCVLECVSERCQGRRDGTRERER
eukprot:257816-Rhodomonas_salina.1